MLQGEPQDLHRLAPAKLIHMDLSLELMAGLTSRLGVNLLIICRWVGR